MYVCTRGLDVWGLNPAVLKGLWSPTATFCWRVLSDNFWTWELRHARHLLYAFKFSLRLNKIEKWHKTRFYFSWLMKILWSEAHKNLNLYFLEEIQYSLIQSWPDIHFPDHKTTVQNENQFSLFNTSHTQYWIDKGWVNTFQSHLCLFQWRHFKLSKPSTQKA